MWLVAWCVIYIIASIPLRAGAVLYDEGAGPCADKCRASNRELVMSLHEDKNAAKLHQLTVQDADMGRMSQPRPAIEVDLNKAGAAGCFAVCAQVALTVCLLGPAGA